MENKDQFLLAQVAQGDNAAFTRLYHQYKQKLYSFLFNIIQSETDAEDGLQEIFLSIHRNRQKLAKVDNFDGYLFTAARNYSVNLLKKNSTKRLIDDLSGFLIIDSSDPETVMKNKQLKEFLEKAKQHLPERQRTAFSLSRDKGYTIAQIAQTMDISESTAKEHVSKALKELRKNYQAYINLVLTLIFTGILIN